MPSSLEERIAKQKARLQQMEATASERRRKQEAREKIIIGGTIVAEMRQNEQFKAQIVQLLNERITKPIDREAVAAWLSVT